MDVADGEICVLLGPSGCGKTTTLKMINRLIEPTSGKIYIDGKDTDQVDPVELRRTIGYVIQQIGLFPNMTVEDNICVVPDLLGWDRSEGARSARAELLDDWSISTRRSSSSAIRRSCRAASSSASASRARSPPIRRCC